LPWRKFSWRAVRCSCGGQRLRVLERGAWVNEWPDALAGALSGPRIAVLTGDHRCLVKEGDLSQSWSDEWADGGVIQCLIAGDRIGVLTNGGTFDVKEGPLNAGWTAELENVLGVTGVLPVD
jgi:hypothetical protein